MVADPEKNEYFALIVNKDKIAKLVRISPQPISVEVKSGANKFIFCRSGMEK